MKRIILSVIAALSVMGCAAQTDVQGAVQKPKVYFIREITPENLVKLYQAMGVTPAEGAKVGVKISTGESVESNHLSPQLISPLVSHLNANLIECNTAYAGNRNTTEAHRREAELHGYTAIAPVDILDADGQVYIPVKGGKHLKYDIVGRNFLNYDFIVVLSHFKGHAMGGFGGALKNISIGLGSSAGKAWIHSAGKCDDPSVIWQGHIAPQDDFLEAMGDASKAIIDFMGPNIVYINIANKLSVDCDCNGHPAKPQMGDLGMYASLDPVALDQACVDAVYSSKDPGKSHLIERIESRNGTHLLDYSQQIGLGSQSYELVVIE